MDNNLITINNMGIKLTDKNNNTIEMTTAEVKINGIQLCWISKPDLVKFYKEMQEVVLKYRI